MSRGVKDLRQLICVSRLNSPEELNEFCDVINLKGYSFIKLQQKSFYKEKIIINSTAGDNSDASKYDKWHDLIDEEILKMLLERANVDLMWLNKWAKNDDCRVRFMNWWLSGISGTECVSIIDQKYSAVCAEVQSLFKNDNLSEQDSMHLLDLVLWEHPQQICGQTCPQLFLDHLEALLLPEDCKRLLSNVNTPPIAAHLILTLRAFTILSMWTSIVRANSPVLLKDNRHISRGLLSIIPVVLMHDAVAVLRYWVERKKVDPVSFRDSEGRSLVTLAVSHMSKLVLRYLVENFDVSSVINCLSEAGNSALHLAVCQGSLDFVSILVDWGHAEVNITNPTCDNCTPLQMAVTYGHGDIAEFLAQRGVHHSIDLSVPRDSINTLPPIEEI